MSSKAVVGASPRLFRPRYAGANLGHPSWFESGVVLERILGLGSVVVLESVLGV